MDIEVDKAYSVRCPFLLSSWWDTDHNGERDYHETWIPGTRWEKDGDDLIKFSDGEGIVRYTVKQIVPIKGYLTRVFYTRTYVDPEGKEFGKNRLKIATTTVFKRYANQEPDWIVNNEDCILEFEEDDEPNRTVSIVNVVDDVEEF